jgi:hypothetical protein
VLAGAETLWELKESGCRTARSFAATILHRSTADATALAQVALQLVAFPQLAETAHRAGRHLHHLQAPPIAPKTSSSSPTSWPRSRQPDVDTTPVLEDQLAMLHPPEHTPPLVS